MNSFLRFSVKKLKHIHNKLQCQYKHHSELFKNGGELTNVFQKPNVEKLNDEYSYGQLSVEYLLVSTKTVDSANEDSLAMKVYNRRQKLLNSSGLDVNSCLQFLLDLYSQWIKTQVIKYRFCILNWHRTPNGLQR